jgi:hypothetical protein
MDKLRLFIWEGDGISDAYHDDGTLVMLAESPDQAREVLRRTIEADKPQQEIHNAAWESQMEKFRQAGGFRTSTRFWESEYAKNLPDQPPNRADGGTLKAMEREPDRVIELDKPRWVAFNGGGYD